MYADVMRSAFALVVASLLLAACAQAPYGDAGIDGSPLETREFNTDNTGNAVCPSELFHYATFSSARCSSPPQRCLSNINGINRIQCECGGTATPGTWVCREMR